MSIDFAALLEQLLNNLPTRIITSNTFKDITIHVENPNGAVDSPNAQYYNSATDTLVEVTEYLSGGGWDSVTHEIKALNDKGIYIEGDSAGATYVNDGVGKPVDCQDAVFGTQVHFPASNTGHFTTTGLYLYWGPKRTHTDRLVGGDGDDVLDGKTGNDILWGGGGQDILKGGADNDELHGGEGHDFLFGEDGADVLYGETSDDYMEGGADNDSLYGGSGGDCLIGGAGHDYLEGGDGE